MYACVYIYKTHTCISVCVCVCVCLCVCVHTYASSRDAKQSARIYYIVIINVNYKGKKFINIIINVIISRGGKRGGEEKNMPGV